MIAAPITSVQPKVFIRTKATKPVRTQKILENPFMLQRELNNRRFFNFFRYFWKEVASTELVANWHIEYLCDELQNVAERVAKRLPKRYDLIINIPPGTTKTTIVSIMYPVWVWTKYHTIKFISAGYSSALSLESAELSRDLIRSDTFMNLYPEIQIKEDKDTKSNYRVVKTWRKSLGRVKRSSLGGNRYSTSVGGTLTGFHGDILIIDDPINPKQAISETALATANRWMGQTLSTRKIDKAVTVTILIMQRLHQDDPTGDLLEKGIPVKHICLPGELGQYEQFVKPTYLAERYIDGLLDPKRLSRVVLSNMEKELGQYGYAGQVGQNPVPPGRGMFKVQHIQILSMILNPVNNVKTVRYWDKAGTALGGAYTVGVKMTKLLNNKVMVNDVKRGQWASEERERIIKETAEADGRDVTVMIEQEPGSGGKESAENTIRNLAGFVCIADRPTGNKTYRADPLSVQVNNGNMLMQKAEWNKKYTDELKFFPFGKYKDQVDASSAAYNFLMNKKVAKRIT